jgi:hypothetical protein
LYFGQRGHYDFALSHRIKTLDMGNHVCHNRGLRFQKAIDICPAKAP